MNVVESVNIIAVQMMMAIGYARIRIARITAYGLITMIVVRIMRKDR